MNEVFIPFDGDYICGDALSDLYDFSRNKFVTKTAPGIGVTTALMNYTGGNLIVISPLTPMIKKKSYDAEKYKSETQFFKCTGLKSEWNTVNSYLKSVSPAEQNIIINCTPDSICNLWDSFEELMNRLVTIPVVVDEYDSVIAQSSLRDDCGRFLELLFKRWEANFTLTTATPNYKFIDVPSDMDINFVRIGPSTNKVKTLAYSNELKDAISFIRKEVEEGRKVACFSNNSKVHRKKITELQSSMVGRNLELKLESYGVKTENLEERDLFETNDVVIYSGKYFIGFDITRNVSIVVISEAGHSATTISLNQAIQALYRCRGTIHNALFVNSGLQENKRDLTSSIRFELENLRDDVEYFTYKAKKLWDSFQVKNSDPITKELYCNRAALATHSLSKVYWYQLQDKNVVQEYFMAYGYNLVDYIKPELEELVHTPTKFNARLLNYMLVDEWEMANRYWEVVEKLRFSQQGSHNPLQVMERLTSLILKILNDGKLLEKLKIASLKPRDFYSQLDKLFQRNFPDAHFVESKVRSDEALRQIRKLNGSYSHEKIRPYLFHWHLFYAMYKAKKLDFSPDVQRYFTIRSSAANLELIKKFKANGVPQKDCVSFVVNDINKFVGGLTEVEIIKIQNIVENGYKDVLDVNFFRNTKKSMLNAFTDSLLWLINPKIKYEEKNNRESNPFTRLPKIFRSEIPYEMVLVDVVSANAQFVDRLIGTSFYTTVYSHISAKQNIDRDSAKKLYSQVLNSSYLDRDEAEDFYRDICGYDSVSANKLAKMTAAVERGSFYKKMTSMEKDLIITYNSEMDNKGLRFHDGLLFWPWELEKQIMRFLNGYEFSVKYFNMNGPYKGEVNTRDSSIMNLPF